MFPSPSAMLMVSNISTFFLTLVIFCFSDNSFLKNTCFFFFFFLMVMPHGLGKLVAQPRMEPMPPAVEAQSLNHASHFKWVWRWCISVVLVCMSLMTGDVQHLSVGLLAICISPLEKCLSPSPIFLSGGFCFCCCWLVEFLMYSKYYFYIRYRIWKIFQIFFHPTGCLFTVLIISFDV